MTVPSQTMVPFHRTWLGAPVEAPRAMYGQAALAACLPIAVFVPLARAIDLHWWTALPLFLVTAACIVVTFFGNKYDNRTSFYMLTAVQSAQILIYWGSFPHALNTFYGTVYVALWMLPVVALWRPVRIWQVEHEDRLEQFHYARTQVPAAEQQPQKVTAAMAARMSSQEKWATILRSVSKGKDFRIIEHQKTNAGEVVHAALPKDGSMLFGTIAQCGEEIEVILDDWGIKVPPKSVTFERAVGRDGKVSSTEFLIHVDVHNVLSTVIPLTVDHTVRSVNEPFSLGPYADGKPAQDTVREKNFLLVGQTGDGKSNALAVLYERITRCNDALLWVVDLKSGLSVRPMLDVWLEGVVDGDTGKLVKRPVPDWVAADRWEAWRMVNAFHELMNARYLHMKTNKLIPTPEFPQIILVIDEASDLYSTDTLDMPGPHYSQFAEIEARSTRKCRGAAMTQGKCLQRNTITAAGSNDADANFLWRMSLGAASQTDAGMVFQKQVNDVNLATLTAGLTERGSMLSFSKEPHDRAMARKIEFVGDDLVYVAVLRELGMKRWERQPVLTGWQKAAVDKWGYSDRWTDRERCGWLYPDDIAAFQWVGKPWNPSRDAGLAIAAEIAAATAPPTTTAVADPSEISRQLAAGNVPTFFQTADPPPAHKELDVDAAWELIIARFDQENDERAVVARPANDMDYVEAALSRRDPELAANLRNVMKVLKAIPLHEFTSAQMFDALRAAGVVTGTSNGPAYRWAKELIEIGWLTRHRKGVYRLMDNPGT